MKPLVLLLVAACGLISPVHAIENESNESWIKKEFRLFRVYPRLDRAQHLEKAQRYTEARRLLEQAVSIDPSYLQARQQLIEICRKLKDFKCSTDHARFLLNLPSGRAIGAYHLMLQAEQDGDEQQVLRWGELALSSIGGHLTEAEKNHIYTSLQTTYGKQHAETSQSPLKVELPQVIEQTLAPTSTTSGSALEEKILLINSLDQQGKLEEALKLAQQLPRNVAARNFQVNLLEKLSRFEEAADLLASYALPREKHSAAYWRQLFNLYEKGKLTSQQVNLLYEAQRYILGDPEILNLASILFLSEVNRFKGPTSAGLSDEDTAARTDEISRLLYVINRQNSDPDQDVYRAYRVDAMIVLAEQYLRLGYEDQSRAVVEDLLTSSLSFSQTEALAPVFWGLGLCKSWLNNNPASLKDNFGAQLLTFSCYRRSGKYAQALEQLTDLVANPSFPAEDKQPLIRTLGYLYLDQNQPADALATWQPLLAADDDEVLALSAAYAATLLGQWQQVTQWLNGITLAELPTSHWGRYWQLKGNLARANQQADEAIHSYTTALSWEPANTDIYLLLIETAASEGKTQVANETWQQLFANTANNHHLLANYAYFLKGDKQTDSAIDYFKQALIYRPDDAPLRRDLAYTYLEQSNYADAIEALKSAIDYSTDKPTDAEAIYSDQQLLHNIDRHWNFEFNETVRLNHGLNNLTNPVIRNSSYRGYGSLLANYLPEFGRDADNNQRLILNGRLFWSNPDQKFSAETDSTVLAIGGRYKLTEHHAIFASAERLIGIGKQAEDDTLLRVSASFSEGLDWPFKKKNWQRQNLYLDAAYFVESNVKYATIDYERGRVLRLGTFDSRFSLHPFLRIGATLNDDNIDRQTETRVDIGAGISLLSKHVADTYKGYQLRVRTSLILNQKIGGNTDDDYAAHFRINVTY